MCVMVVTVMIRLAAEQSDDSGDNSAQVKTRHVLRSWIVCSMAPFVAEHKCAA